MTPTDQHRRAQLGLRAATVRDMLVLWPGLDPRRLDATFPTWLASVQLLVNRNRQVSAGLAGAYLRALRFQQTGSADVAVRPPGDVVPDKLAVSMLVDSVVAVKKATARGEKLAVAAEKAFVLSSGDASRLVLESGRETVMQTVAADPKAVGWQRVVGGRACEFCQALAGQGAHSEEGASFESHGHCGCTAEPVYK